MKKMGKKCINDNGEILKLISLGLPLFDSRLVFPQQ